MTQLVDNLRDEISKCRVIQSEITRHLYHEDSLENQKNGYATDNQGTLQQDSRRVERLLIDLEKLAMGLSNGT